MKRLIIVLLFTALIFTGCQSGANTTNDASTDQIDSQSETTGEENPAEGIDLSDLIIKTYDGNKVDKDTFNNNKLTVLNLWATWCGPCVEEMPDLQKVSESYKGKDVQVHGLAVDSSEDEVIALKEQLNITYPLLKENEEVKEVLISKFDYVPVTLFVNSDGKILKTFVAGSISEEDLTKLIEGIINE